MNRRTIKTKAGAAPALAAAALLVAVGGAAETPFARPGATTVAAVFPPWWAKDRIWSAARGAGAVSAAGASPFVLVVHSAEADPRNADLATRARRAGALLVLDPHGFAGCGPLSQDFRP